MVECLNWARVNSGEIWYFRQGEPLSPKREYQKLLRGTCASCRSGEEVSPKRDNATMPLFHFSSSCLGESSSLERENPLAWAKPFSLSENWVRMCPGPGFFSILRCFPHVWLNYYVKAWNGWFCKYWMVYGLKLMSLTWSWHVTWMGWLVISVDMELVCIMTLCWLEKHDVGMRKSTKVSWWCLIGQNIIPWIFRWDLISLVKT